MNQLRQLIYPATKKENEKKKGIIGIVIDEEKILDFSIVYYEST